MKNITIKNLNNNQTKGMLEQLFSVRQVAELFGVHTETIKRYAAKGLLEKIKINSRVTRFRWSSVNELLANATIRFEKIEVTQ